MKNNNLSSFNIANNMIGIGMISSSLVVILFAVAVFLYQQKNDDLSEMQSQGVGLVRLLGSMSVAQLTTEGNKVGPLRLLKETQVSNNFAYVSVVGIDGTILAEYDTPGVMAPPRTMPQRPSLWVGEREHQSEKGAVVHEYFAPVIENGELKAFVRLGYLEPTYALNASQVRLLAIQALAIFLLTPIFYFMVKMEFKPLTRIGSQLHALVKKTQSGDADISSNGNSQHFMQKFSTVIEAAYNHIDALEEKQTSSVVSCKLLVYQRARLEAAIDALPYAILVADESGQVTYTNNKIHQLLGTKEGEVLGCSLADLSENRELSECLVSCQAGNAANMYQHDEADIFLPETGKSLAISSYPLYSLKSDNQLLGTVITFRDITDADIVQNNNGQFIAHVAHELKSPLNVLYMYSEILLDNADASRELTIDAANVIHDETSRITQMIDNLLNLAMIEMGNVSMQRQRVKMADFLDDIYQSMLHDKQVEEMDFKLKMPRDLGTLLIDKDLVRVSINNLISNAIKYNQPGGKIELIAENNDTDFIIRVRDTGIGISALDQQHIFGKFFRSESEEVRKRTGHGLGLSLVHETVKLHHGKIHINSTLGEGTEFVMSFTKESNMLKDAI